MDKIKTLFNTSYAKWLAVGWLAFLLLPWHGIYEGFWGFSWLTDYPFGKEAAPAILQILLHGKLWLLPLAALLALPFSIFIYPKDRAFLANALIWTGLAGFIYLLFQGFALGIDGWRLDIMAGIFGPITDRQPGLGYGALVLGGAFLFLFSEGLAAKGLLRGDSFIIGSLVMVIALVGLFVFLPILVILFEAFLDNQRSFAPFMFVEKFLAPDIWSLGCINPVDYARCGVAWNTLSLAILTGLSTTLLGLTFAILVTRSNFPYKKFVRLLTIIPIITPPFVLGLAVILLFGRSGAVTTFMADIFNVTPSRWIYGLPGLWLAQTLAFTPIAFLVLIGVVEGVSPSLEEAAQTLRAGRWQTFRTVSLPLMRPGIANAFLLGFVESMADFGNPLVFGGNYDVLATEIYFAIVGAQHDQSRASILAIILLTFTLSAFWIQRRWVGSRRSYASFTGKGDAGLPLQLPTNVRRSVMTLATLWVGFSLVIYAMVIFGGFVKIWGRDHSFTLTHYIAAFGIDWSEHGIVWSGSAWNSFWTTIKLALIAAPFTAAIGLLIAYILGRQRFRGRSMFEFFTMLSFAIPGTVIGVSYILTFNLPPIEITGTGVILIVCFIFRNMPVGIRAGLATLTQIDKSLDESSLTLRATSFHTVRKVILPLMRPAIVAALVYSFVRAITSVSAVIFLVSANYDLATAHIVGRVENGDYGVAIAYSSVLILLMLAGIGLIQLFVGERSVGRRAPALAGGAP